MRLATFRLENYGSFRQCELAFSTEAGRLTLVVAPNGRGKSVIRRAIGDFLFDIPERSEMGFLHGTQHMRLIGRIAAPPGEPGGERLLARRKGRGNTLSVLTEAEPAAVEADALRALVGGADRALFDQLFALDTALLRQGAEELLRAGGRLGQVLFAGGGGLGQVHRLLDGLTARRDEIGPLRNIRSRPLWSALDEMKLAGKALRAAGMRPEEWRTLEQRVAVAEEDLARLRRSRSGVEAALGRHAMARAVRPWLRARENAQERLQAAGDAPRVDVGFEESWRQALAAHAQADSAAAEAARHLAAQSGDEVPPETAPDAALLAAAASITALAEAQGVAAEAARDLPPLVARHGAAQATMARLRAELGWNDAVALPPAPALRGARQSLARRPALAAAAAQASREAEDAARRLAEGRSARDGAAPPADATALMALAGMLRAEGDPARRMAAALAAGRDAAAALDAALAAIPDRPLSDVALRQTAAPSAPALAAAEARLTEALAALRTAQQDQRRLDGDVAAAAEALAALLRESALPDPGALAAARSARDRLWMGLQAAVSGTGSAAESAAAPMIALDRAMRLADDVADALVAHSAQFAQAASLRARLAALERQREAAAAACHAADGALADAQTAFAQLATMAGAAGDVLPAALREFLTARQIAVDRRADLVRVTEAVAALEQWVDAHASRLAIALGRDPPGNVADLSALLAAADAAIEAARDGQARLRELDDRLVALQRDAAMRGAEAARAGTALAAWEARWRDEAAALSRPAGETAEASAAALDLIEELRSAQTMAAEDSGRIIRMREAIASFAVDVTALVRRVAPDLLAGAGGLPAAELAARLTDRLTEARAAAARRDAQAAARAASLAAAEAARTDATSAARHLAALRAALHAPDDAAAETQLRRAREATLAEADLAHAELQLRELGGGEDVPALERLVAGIGESEADFANFSAEAAALAPAAEAAAAELRSAVEARDRQAGSEDAPAAAARQEAARAALAEHAEQALLLHAAASLLKAGLERQRGASESRLVRRIGAVFAGLTCGDHAGVAVQETGPAATLVALERDGAGRKQLGELSEGTRDQLYLALRIVALEQYAAGAPALPFIADDVLQTFDDARTRASLEALLGLSAHVQVIALTHHPHVAAIAAGLPVDVVMLAD
jgi:uncharacterized protein YhaN